MGRMRLALACVLGAGVLASADTSPVTPVSGPSHLRRLGLTMRQSAMGAGGSWGAVPVFAAPATGGAPSTGQADLTTLTGADLFRLDCRPCHRADGSGTPPEIPSMIEPIRSTSALAMRQRMQDRGTPISAAFAEELAAGSRSDVRTRLRNGGDKMPAFRHLSDIEVDALLAYLDLLAGIPGAERRQVRIAQPAHRVGEHLVKGTCQICHGATGAWPGPEALLQGEVPSLAGIARRTLPDVVRKVRQGAPVTMGRALISSRGRMATFGYLTDSEVTAAYRYLVAYPPQASPLPALPAGRARP